MGKLLTVSFLSFIALLFVFQDQVASSYARAPTNKKYANTNALGKRKSSSIGQSKANKAGPKAMRSHSSRDRRHDAAYDDEDDDEDMFDNDEDEDKIGQASYRGGNKGRRSSRKTLPYGYEDEEDIDDGDFDDEEYDDEYDEEKGEYSDEEYDDDEEGDDDDDLEDEDDEDEDYGRGRGRGGRGIGGSGGGGRSYKGQRAPSQDRRGNRDREYNPPSMRRGVDSRRGAMAPYGGYPPQSNGYRDPRGYGEPPSGYAQAATSTSMFAMLDKAKAAVEDARTKANKMTRLAKGVVSSNYEKLLLDATTPDEEPVSQKHVGQLIGAITSFRKHGDFDSDRNPYRVTLRKIWNKIVERDYRTKVKALYLLHRIVRDSSPRDGYVFQTQLRRMRAEINPKAPPLHYFNLQQVCALNANGELFEEFVENYGRFLFRRAYHFTSRCEEMKALSIDADRNKVLSVQEALSLMSTASTLLESGMKCELDDETECFLLCSTMELVLIDIKDIWKYYQQGVKRLIGQDDTPSFGMKRVNEKELVRMLEGYNVLRTKVNKYLKRNAKLLSQYRIRLSLDLSNKVDEDVLKEKIFKLKNPEAAGAATTTTEAKTTTAATATAASKTATKQKSSAEEKEVAKENQKTTSGKSSLSASPKASTTTPSPLRASAKTSTKSSVKTTKKTIKKPSVKKSTK